MQDDTLLQAVLESIPPADRLAALLELDPGSLLIHAVPKVLVRLDCDDAVLLAALHELHGISTHAFDRQHAGLLHALYGPAHRDARTGMPPGQSCSPQERQAFVWHALDDLLAPSTHRDYVILADSARRLLLPLVSGAGALQERVERVIAADRRLRAFHAELERLIDEERPRYETAMASGATSPGAWLDAARIYSPPGILEGRDPLVSYRRAVHNLRIRHGFEAAPP
jgi:hypothetical protein